MTIFRVGNVAVHSKNTYTYTWVMHVDCQIEIEPLSTFTQTEMGCKITYETKEPR